MKREEIIDLIRKSKFKKDKRNKFGPSESSEILCIQDGDICYGVWIVRYLNTNDELIGVCKFFPKYLDATIEDLPKEIDEKNICWAKNFKNK